MKKTALRAAMQAAHTIHPQASPRHRADKPRIEPVMTLRPSAADASAYELLIYGDIGDSWWGESVTAQSIAQQLNDLDATVATINVRINSYGGSVADGLAIYNALKRHKATKAVTVDGVAMSSASMIAMAGDTVSMPPTSVLMIHAPWGGCYGNAKEMRQYADVLDKFADAMVDAYVAKSSMDRSDMLSLLTDGEDHYYTGEEAIAAGFADSVADDSVVDEPSENARAFAAAMLERIGARCPAKYASLATAAALRGARFDSATSAPVAGHSTPPASAEQIPPDSAGNPAGDVIVTEEEKKAAAKAVLAADKARREAIRAQFAPFIARGDSGAEIAALQTQCEDDHDTTVDAAGKRLLALLGASTTPATPAGGGHIEITREETATYREGAIVAVLNRANPAAHKADERSAQFRGMSLLDLARDCSERAGRRTRGMSRQEIAVVAMQSTSDFPAILSAAVNKSLRAGYEGTMRTFTAFCRQATLPDLKEISRTQLSGAPGLKRVQEGAEYEYGSMSDGAEKYAVLKYGRRIALTWETIINDDLDALSRIPQAFGASAADLESDIVYGVLTGNAKMSDGKTLFHSDHGNIGTATALKDALDAAAARDPIADMREQMLLQKGLEGRYITVRPSYLIVPPRLEQTALRICSAAFQATRGVDVNVMGSLLTPIVEPRLHDTSDTAYYGAAAPSTVDTIEYAYLQGHEGVFTESRNGFEVDGVEIKCRHVFGAKAIDHRGLWRNAGA